MPILDSWEEVQSLQPGKPYRCYFKTICLNSVPNSDFAAELFKVGIVTNNPGVSGPVTAVMSGYTMHFQVSKLMTSSQFASALIAAFSAASAQSWFECSTPEISSVAQRVAGEGLGGSGFQLGAVFALVIVGVVAVMVCREK